MAKCLIVYFSQGGTTARVAEAIAAGLAGAAYTVDLHNLKVGSPSPLAGYDLLGIGSPAYIFRPPYGVTAYAESLPTLDGLPAFVFVLHGTYRGDTGNILWRTLRQRGARPVGYYHCRGADYFVRYLKEGYLFSPEHPMAEEVANAEAFGRTVAANAAGRVAVEPPPDPAPGPIYRLEQLVTSRWLAKEFYSRTFAADAKKCDGCGVCRRVCPNGNIGGAKGDRPSWGRDCLMCFYCELRCPRDAITSAIDWPVFRPFMLYNVRRASGDRTLDHHRVVHSQGRTRPV